MKKYNFHDDNGELPVETVDFNNFKKVNLLVWEAKREVGYMNYCRVDCFNMETEQYLKDQENYTRSYRKLMKQAEDAYSKMNDCEKFIYRKQYGHPYDVIRKAVEENYMFSES